jgi:hypothetical protein
VEDRGHERRVLWASGAALVSKVRLVLKDFFQDQSLGFERWLTLIGVARKRGVKRYYKSGYITTDERRGRQGAAATLSACLLPLLRIALTGAEPPVFPVAAALSLALLHHKSCIVILSYPQDPLTADQ